MELREPLFLGADFLNIRQKEKGTPSISVRVNLQRDDLIYVQSIKSRIEVIGYVDPATGLFVSETEDTETGSVYQQFRQEAVRYAKEELMKFLDQLEKLSDEEYTKTGYKPFNTIANGLKKCLTDRQALYSDLQKQVNLVVSRKFPKVNEYMVYEDDPEIKYPITAKVPYKNPENVTLTDDKKKLVNDFLDVFFDNYNKYVFSWYMGAALLNIPLYDDRVSKLVVLSSSLGGSGKSSLVMAMANGLFTQHYRDIKDNFDSFFTTNNRFGTSALSTKRLCVYSEASFNSDQLAEEHDFSGINVSAIKSMVTEGYLTEEEKFGDRNMEKLSGFHIVLTNHPPMITAENQAMNRRILSIMLQPTSMSEKAKTLNLWGKKKLDNFVKENAESFAAYFVSVFKEDEYAFVDYEYNHNEYLLDIKDSQEDLTEKQKEGRKQLDNLKAEGLIEFIEGLEKEHQLQLDLMKKDIRHIMGGGTKTEIQDHIKLVDGILYFNASKDFLLRYGPANAKIRDYLKMFYGEPVKKYHKRMFVMPLTKNAK